MADHSLAHRAQNPTRTETVHLPPTAPPANHGKTVAAWVTMWGIMIGALVASLATAFAVVWLFWVGLGVVLLSLVLGKILQLAGFGQGGEKTVARQKAHGGH